MSISRQSSINHVSLMIFMQSLGYSITGDGVCFGVASMGAQAVLLEQTRVFNDRLKLIGRIFQSALAEIFPIILTERMQQKLLKKKLSAQEVSHKELLYKILRNKIGAVAQKKKIDILAFFDGVKSYQEAGHKDEVRDIVASLQMEELGFIREGKNIPSFLIFTSLYSSGLPHVIHYFKFLRVLAKKHKAPICLVLSAGPLVEIDIEDFEPPPLVSDAVDDTPPTKKKWDRPPGHAIAVGYIPARDIWIFIDSNHRPLRAIEVRTNSDVVEKINAAFNLYNETLIVSNTKFFMAGCHQDILEKIILNWRLHDAQEKIVKLKAELGTSRYSALTALKKISSNSDNAEYILQAFQSFEDLESCSRIIDFNSDTKRKESKKHLLNAIYEAYVRAKRSDEFVKIVKHMQNNLHTNTETPYVSQDSYLNKCGFFSKAGWIVQQMAESLCPRKLVR